MELTDELDQTAAGDFRAERSARVEDRRTETATPMGYLICTDAFLSGWRNGPRRSLYALAFHCVKEAEALEIAAKGRSDMKRPRIVSQLKADGTPKIRLEPGDHLAIVDRGEASEWYRGAAARWNQGE